MTWIADARPTRWVREDLAHRSLTPRLCNTKSLPTSRSGPCSVAVGADRPCRRPGASSAGRVPPPPSVSVGWGVSTWRPIGNAWGSPEGPGLGYVEAPVPYVSDGRGQRADRHGIGQPRQTEPGPGGHHHHPRAHRGGEQRVGEPVSVHPAQSPPRRPDGLGHRSHQRSGGVRSVTSGMSTKFTSDLIRVEFKEFGCN